MKAQLVLVILTGFVTGAVQAQDRYQLLDRGGSLVRMDRVTGQVSTCRKVGVSLACSIAADEREALLSANEELSSRIDALDQRLKLLEKPDSTTRPDESAQEDNSEDIPGFDKAMEVTERVMRRMIAMMKELKGDFESN